MKAFKFLFNLAVFMLACFGGLCLYEMISRDNTPQDELIMPDKGQDM